MLIFLSFPTTGVVLNNAIRPTVLARIAQLHEQHPEHTFLVPMVQGYAFVPYMAENTPVTWEVWQHYCRDMIDVCKEVWVLMYEGWSDRTCSKSPRNTSSGVNGEIQRALYKNIPVKFIEP